MNPKISQALSLLVTATTITDEQIRELLADALDGGDREGAKLTQVALGMWHGSHAWKASDSNYTPACAICGAHPHDKTSDHIEPARARCAEILNARAKEAK